MRQRRGLGPENPARARAFTNPRLRDSRQVARCPGAEQGAPDPGSPVYARARAAARAGAWPMPRPHSGVRLHRAGAFSGSRSLRLWVPGTSTPTLTLLFCAGTCPYSPSAATRAQPSRPPAPRPCARAAELSRVAPRAPAAGPEPGCGRAWGGQGETPAGGRPRLCDPWGQAWRSGASASWPGAGGGCGRRGGPQLLATVRGFRPRDPERARGALVPASRACAPSPRLPGRAGSAWAGARHGPAWAGARHRPAASPRPAPRGVGGRCRAPGTAGRRISGR